MRQQLQVILVWWASLWCGGGGMTWMMDTFRYGSGEGGVLF